MSTPHTDRVSGAMSAAAAGPGHPVAAPSLRPRSAAAPSLRALVEAATPGPWESRDAAGERGIERVIIADAKDTRPDHVVASTGVFPDRSAPPDADFIAASREAVPLLLDVLEAARWDDLRYEYRAALADAIRAFETWERER